MKKVALFGVIGIFMMVLVSGCTVISLVAGTYNGLVAQRENTKASWGQVQNVYQRRADLVPNLIETVRGYAIHENDTFVSVTEARAKVGQINIKADQIPSAVALQKFQQAQGELSSSLSRLMVVSENYPNLKASESFRDLMVQMEGTENRIANERRNFNKAAQDYNAYRSSFPHNIIADYYSFEVFPYFEAEAGANKVPKADFKDLRQK